MKRLTPVAAALSLSFLLAASTSLFAENNPKPSTKPAKEVNWKAYGQNLGAALRSDNAGLQRSALQTIILKGDKLILDESMVDLLNVYLVHEHEGFRQLALVAIHKTGDAWAMNYLKRHAHEETSPKLKKVLDKVLVDYYGN